MTTSMTMADLDVIAKTIGAALDAKGSRKDRHFRKTVLTMLPLGDIKVEITHHWHGPCWSLARKDKVPVEHQSDLASILVAWHQDIDDILAKLPKHLK